ncbi:MAG TPA: DUF4838 domain-containing protein [Candidatus Brocadiia bacterium]|nr:DUF4838 domain-containing protein [Candidatus Brocadiia bacterium]
MTRSARIVILALTIAVAGCADRARVSGQQEILKHPDTQNENIIKLARDGVTDYTICVSTDAIEPEKLAARELSRFMGEIAGAEFPIVEGNAPKEPAIIVGNGAILNSAAPDLAELKFGDEELIIAARGRNLILAGGRPRGTLYAVYEFLDTRMGCRWYTKDVSVIPRQTSIELAFADYRFNPVLEYREPFFTEAFDGEWCMRNRMNSTHGRLSATQGGNISYRGFVHTFYSLLPPEQYFKEHPEYYSEIYRRRVGDKGQLCLTNPDVLRIVTDKVREWARQEPKADIISVSQNDWWGWCSCAKCSELAKREGSQAGPIIHFVNQIADSLKEEFPDLAIDTLAYSYSRKPPKFARPRPNVIVRLCSIECCFCHPLDAPDCQLNAKFAEDIREWAKICDRLYIWNYNTDFAHYHAPFPNIRVIGPNIEFFAKHNVRGIFEQGAYPSCGGGEGAELKSYIMARCLWKPGTDSRAVTVEFLRAVYGPAANAMLKYYDVLHDAVEKRDVHVGIFMSPSQWFSPELLKACREPLDEAAAAVKGNTDYERRVRQARMWLKYAELNSGERTWRRDGDVISQDFDKGYGELLEGYIADLKEFGVNQIRESGNLESWIQSMRSNALAKKCPVLRLRNPAMQCEIIPSLGGRIHQVIITGEHDMNIIHSTGPGSEGYPFDGGYEEYTQRAYRSVGWEEEFKVLGSSARSLLMQAVLKDGVVLSRTVTIAPEKPFLTISTRYENTSQVVQAIAPRAHPSFSLGDPSRCVVFSLKSDGIWTCVRLNADAAHSEQEFWIDAAAKSKGQWILWNTELNIGILNRFDPAQVEKQLVNWNMVQKRINIELWFNQKRLPASTGATFEHSYEVIRKLPDGATL